MKSRVRTYSKKEIGWLCGEAMEEIDRCINSNGIVFLIALMRHTGWKQKRMEDFIKTLNETMDEYHQHTTGIERNRSEHESGAAGITAIYAAAKKI